MMSMSIMIDGHAVSAGGSNDDDDEDDDGGVKEVKALFLPGERGRLIRGREVAVVITDIWKTTKLR